MKSLEEYLLLVITSFEYEMKSNVLFIVLLYDEVENAKEILKQGYNVNVEDVYFGVCSLSITRKQNLITEL